MDSIVTGTNGGVQATVRRMRGDDAEAAARLLRAAYGKPDSGTISTVGSVDLPLTASRVRQWRQCSAGSWVAEVAGYGPVGAVFAVVEPDAAWIAGLGVAPGFRGAGAGAALTDHALDFLAAHGRRVVGMEVAPTSVRAAGMYARRGFRPADLTVRLRGVAGSLGGPVDLRGWREVACSDLIDHAQVREALAVARVRTQPYSPASYLLISPDVTLLCDPDPLIPAANGSLDLRLVVGGDPQSHDVEVCVGAAARSAALRGLSSLDVDLALANGVLLSRLLSLGMAPIASTLRLVSDLDAYVAWRGRHGPIGRWSF